MTDNASPLDPPPIEAAPKAGLAAPRATWKPWTVTAAIWALPTLLALILLMVVGGDYLAVMNRPAPKGAPPEAPLEALWTDVERERLQEHPFFREGVLAEDLRPWAFTPQTGMASVRGAAARGPYERALVRLNAGARGENPDALGEATNLLAEADRALAGGSERGPILYHQALAAYWTGEYGPSLRYLQGDSAGDQRGLLALIKDARNSDLDTVEKERLNGEEIAARYLLGHVLLKTGKAKEAMKEFETALSLASGVGYRSQYSGLIALDPRRHLVNLHTASIWTDLIAARARADALWQNYEDDRDHRSLFDRPRAVSGHRQLAAAVALLAARDGRADIVSRIDLPAGADSESNDAYAIAWRATGLGTPAQAPVSPSLVEAAQDWDRISCLRRKAAPWLGKTGSRPSCGRRDLAGFEGRWRGQFMTRYAEALSQTPGGAQWVAADSAFGYGDRWNATQRLNGQQPWLAFTWRAILFVLAAIAVWAAVVVTRRYDDQFGPMHFRYRRRHGQLAVPHRAG